MFTTSIIIPLIVFAGSVVLTASPKDFDKAQIIAKVEELKNK